MAKHSLFVGVVGRMSVVGADVTIILDVIVDVFTVVGGVVEVFTVVDIVKE